MVRAHEFDPLSTASWPRPPWQRYLPPCASPTGLGAAAVRLPRAARAQEPNRSSPASSPSPSRTGAVRTSRASSPCRRRRRRAPTSVGGRGRAGSSAAASLSSVASRLRWWSAIQRTSPHQTGDECRRRPNLCGRTVGQGGRTGQTQDVCPRPGWQPSMRSVRRAAPRRSARRSCGRAVARPWLVRHARWGVPRRHARGLPRRACRALRRRARTTRVRSAASARRRTAGPLPPWLPPWRGPLHRPVLTMPHRPLPPCRAQTPRRPGGPFARWRGFLWSVAACAARGSGTRARPLSPWHHAWHSSKRYSS